MTRYALMLCASILAAACAACVPHPPQTSEPVPTAILALPAPRALPTGCALNDVGLLNASFNETSLEETPRSTGTPPKPIIDDLMTAYNISPPFFQKRLCNLDGIFITKGPKSGGYRNINDGRRYIALSINLWEGSSLEAIPLDKYHNTVFKLLTSWPGTDSSIPSYLPATPNHGVMTVLAILAHEYGHILWADIFIEARGKDRLNFNKFCRGTFPRPSWENLPHPRRWREFGVITDTPEVIPDDPDEPRLVDDPPAADIKAAKLKVAVDKQEFDRARKILAKLHAEKRPWPSLFGAFSVNEHFVETFVLHTLINSPTSKLTSLPLKITRSVIPDIPKTIDNRRKLKRLLKCFDVWFRDHPDRDVAAARQAAVSAIR